MVAATSLPPTTIVQRRTGDVRLGLARAVVPWDVDCMGDGAPAGPTAWTTPLTGFCHQSSQKRGFVGQDHQGVLRVCLPCRAPSPTAGLAGSNEARAPCLLRPFTVSPVLTHDAPSPLVASSLRPFVSSLCYPRGDTYIRTPAAAMARGGGARRGGAAAAPSAQQEASLQSCLTDEGIWQYLLRAGRQVGPSDTGRQVAALTHPHPV